MSTLTPPGAAFEPGQRIGSYELLDELGRGGMGVVYRARHVEVGREVALKLMLADQVLDPRQLERFQAEAEALGRLSHPGIVGVHEAGWEGRNPYLVMDLVQGESLKERLQRGLLEPNEAADLTRQLAEALQAAHEQKVLHRDLKPANVLLDEDRKPRITDFGLALHLDGDRERLTRTGQMLGTPAYMPPEQADGQLSAMGVCSDVYALGATLYATMTGRPPFEGSTAINIIAKVLGREPIPPTTVRPGIPPDLEAVCLKCLEKLPEERYPTAVALADDLDRFLNGRETLARPPTRLHKLRSSLRRHRLVAVMMGTLLFFGAVLAAVLATGLARSNGPSSDVSEEPEQPIVTSREEWEAKGEREFRALLRNVERNRSPETRLTLAESWLEEFAGHRLEPRVRKVANQTRVSRLYRDEVAVGFTHTNQLVTWHREETRVLIRSLDAKAPQHVLNAPATIEAAEVAPDGAGIYLVAGDRLLRYGLEAKKPSSSFPLPEGRVGRLRASSKGDLLAVTCLLPEKSWSLYLIETRTGKLVHRFSLHPAIPMDIAFVPEGRRLVVVGGDPKNTQAMGLLWIIDLRTGAVERRVTATRGQAACFTGRGEELVVGTVDRRLRVYDTLQSERPDRYLAQSDTGQAQITPTAEGATIHGVVTSGTRLYCSWGDGLQNSGLSVWDLATGTRPHWVATRRPPWAKSPDLCLGQGTDGDYLAWTTWEGVRVWWMRKSP